MLPDERAEEPFIADALLCCQASQQQDATTLFLQASNQRHLKASTCTMVKMKAPGQCNMFFVAKERKLAG